nr:hypothetical protein CFP56_19652 [Quercus suber]
MDLHVLVRTVVITGKHRIKLWWEQASLTDLQHYEAVHALYIAMCTKRISMLCTPIRSHVSLERALVVAPPYTVSGYWIDVLSHPEDS